MSWKNAGAGFSWPIISDTPRYANDDASSSPSRIRGRPESQLLAIASRRPRAASAASVSCTSGNGRHDSGRRITS